MHFQVQLPCRLVRQDLSHRNLLCIAVADLQPPVTIHQVVLGVHGVGVAPDHDPPVVADIQQVHGSRVGLLLPVAVLGDIAFGEYGAITPDKRQDAATRRDFVGVARANLLLPAAVTVVAAFGVQRTVVPREREHPRAVSRNGHGIGWPHLHVPVGAHTAEPEHGFVTAQEQLVVAAHGDGICVAAVHLARPAAHADAVLGSHRTARVDEHLQPGVANRDLVGATAWCFLHPAVPPNVTAGIHGIAGIEHHLVWPTNGDLPDGARI